jgi:hypothetical protein
VQVDGGINASTAGAAVRAGADVLVAGSALYGHKQVSRGWSSRGSTGGRVAARAVAEGRPLLAVQGFQQGVWELRAAVEAALAS